MNEAGLDFYDRLVDGLLAAGIAPLPTLYHWDLPQRLEDEGGWTNRATAVAFADYAAVVVARLGRPDRAVDDAERAVRVGQPRLPHRRARAGRSVTRRPRSPQRTTCCSATASPCSASASWPRRRAPASCLNFTPVVAASDDPADVAEAALVDGVENRWYVEPLAGLGYPADTVARLGWDQAEVRAGDLELIAQPIDVLGVNFYSRTVARADRAEDVRDVPRTAMGWEIHPDSFGALLRRLHSDYRFPALPDHRERRRDARHERRPDGRIDDQDRIAYVADHLAQIHDAIGDGVPVEGYFVWSLLDNFEWAHGYGPRFGIVEIDRDTLARTPKASALWYRDVCRTGTLPIA